MEWNEFAAATKDALEADNSNEATEVLDDEVIVAMAKYFQANGYTPGDVYGLKQIYFMYDMLMWMANQEEE